MSTENKDAELLPQWSCQKRFVLTGGELDLDAERELYKVSVRRSFTPGVWRWSAFVYAESAGAAAIISNQMLIELLGPYGVAVLVTDSDNMRVQEHVGYCSEYCAHNVDKECGCQSCVWIRENAGYVHEFNCRYGPRENRHA